MDNLADGKQEVTVGGRTRHALGYLQDFLFEPKRARTPVKALSGGEKNRLLLARLFLKSNNLLILDEPTNDLDIETLELLEEILANYQGTLLLVSHDRQFVDNTVMSSWIFEGNGKIEEFVGGYHDAQEQRAQVLQSRGLNVADDIVKPTEKVTEEVPKPQPVESKPKKLSYKLQRELESLPQLLEKLEAEVDELQEKVNQPDFFNQSSDDTQAVLNRLNATEQELETAFARWEELESMQA